MEDWFVLTTSAYLLPRSEGESRDVDEVVRHLEGVGFQRVPTVKRKSRAWRKIVAVADNDPVAIVLTEPHQVWHQGATATGAAQPWHAYVAFTRQHRESSSDTAVHERVLTRELDSHFSTMRVATSRRAALDACVNG